LTRPTLTVELGTLTGWELGTSLLGTDTYLATVSYDIDITDKVRSVSIRRGRQHELNRIEAGTASVMVLNQDGAMTRIPPMTAIRIRASFDEFPSVSGLVARYDFNDISTLWKDTARTSAVTADADVIKGVTDLSGTGNHLSEATNGPAYKVNIQNGKSVSRYDGTNDVLQSADITDISTPTLFVVVKHATGTPPGQQGILGDPSDALQLYVHSTGFWAYYAGTEQATAIDVNTNAHILVGKFNGAGSVLYVDGSVGSTANPGAGALTTGIRVGANSSNFLNGDICEVVVYNSVLSSTNINLVGNHLASKWGTTWTTV
jgi:hypothetical protein